MSVKSPRTKCQSAKEVTKSGWWPEPREGGLLPVRTNPWAEKLIEKPLGSSPPAWSPLAQEQARVPAEPAVVLLHCAAAVGSVGSPPEIDVQTALSQCLQRRCELLLAATFSLGVQVEDGELEDLVGWAGHGVKSACLVASETSCACGVPSVKSPCGPGGLHDTETADPQGDAGF